eukprot:Skav225211  [mRNA]  locus=scaffold1041:177991:195589:- [translate_table: standard]
MEHLGLDVSDPLPPQPSHLEEEMAPGLLEYDEILEPDVKSLRPGASAEPGGGAEDELMGALKEEGGAVEHLWHMEQDELAGAGMAFSSASRFEWVQNLPEQSFQEQSLLGAFCPAKWLGSPAAPGTHRWGCSSAMRLRAEVQTMFSFTADRPGNFTSSWCLKTYPHLKKPITELAMNASATLSDLHWERRSALQEYIRKEQTISLASELAEDIVDAVRLQPPPLPPLSEPAVQERCVSQRVTKGCYMLGNDKHSSGSG